MDKNDLYFIKDEYFEKYQSDNNESNKGEGHDRPCYYSFSDGSIHWMVPISSRVHKYEVLYNKAIEKYGSCDTLAFLYIKGNLNVALIQNMIPVTDNYIKNVYLDVNTNKPIQVNDKKKREINAKVRKVLRLSGSGKKLTFTPIQEFKERLLEEYACVEEIDIIDQDNNEDTP